MSLSENLDDVFEMIKKRDQTISLQAFDIFCMFPHELINDFLRRNDFANARMLVDVISSVRMVNEGLLESIILLASNEQCATLVAENEKVIQRLYSLAKHGDPLKFVLPLTQVSRMAAETTQKTLFKLQGNYISLLTETFNACDGGKNQPERLINVAYVFLNVTQFKLACEQLFGTAEEVAILSSFITNPNSITAFKCIIAKILLNISFHPEMHSILLNDQFIADIVDPFADEGDDLSTEEMDKLPLQLQYVDHKRSQSATLLDTLIEVMSSLCISKQGREKLRELGIYAILREFDKARRGNNMQLVENRFMTIEGTPEWNLLMNTLLFEDHELQADGDLEHKMTGEITEFNLDDLASELNAIELENSEQKQEEVE